MTEEERKGPGRPMVEEDVRRRPASLSLTPWAIRTLKEEATRRGVSQSRMVEEFLEQIRPKPVTPAAAIDSWSVDELVDAIITVQSKLRAGNVEMGAVDRNGVAPVQSWLVGLRNDINDTLRKASVEQ